MRLAEFIRDNREAIVGEWETFARSLVSPWGEFSPSVLRDHANEILDAVVTDMTLFQSLKEQAEKSKGRGHERRMGSAGQVHADMRLDSGFRLDQLIAEYRALRASVLRLWKASGQPRDLDGVTRFNEAIDEALLEAARGYMAALEHHRDEFLGILGHDLRNPLSAIIMGAEVLVGSGGLDETGASVVARILTSGRRMHRMVDDLLDLTRTRLGGGLPVHRAPMNLAPLCGQVVAELEGSHPDAPLQFTAKGDLHGAWDGDRLAQVVSNLVGNAIQHGKKNAPVTLIAQDHGDEIVLEVHNEGPPIAESAMSSIFEPMVSHDHHGGETSGNLGLGLYIAEQVVKAHGGRIDVTSTRTAGTTFIMHLPRG